MEHRFVELCAGDLQLRHQRRVLVRRRMLGVVCKSRIPEAHTVLEVIRIRYGKETSRLTVSPLTNIECYLEKTAHLSFAFLAVVDNLLKTINMILGASAATSLLWVP